MGPTNRDAELDLERAMHEEYRDAVGRFAFAVETERRFYLTNHVDVQVHADTHPVHVELTMTDAWVWDMYRPARTVRDVRVISFSDVNVETLAPGTSG